MSRFRPESDPSVRAMTRRPSYPSSSSSFSSSFNLSDQYSPLFSPYTTLKISGIPFSWEKLPGIPKKETSANKKQDLFSPLNPNNNLPLPPPTNSKNTIFNKDLISRKKKSNSHELKGTNKDPFLAAFVACCKNDDEDDDYDQEISISSHWEMAKTARNPTVWYGFVNLSCKRSCSVSESIVYIPRSGKNLNYRGHRNVNNS